MNTLDFDRNTARRLRLMYDRAARDGEDTFVFDGHTLVTNYAYYMLEYLSERLQDPSLKPPRQATD